MTQLTLSKSNYLKESVKLNGYERFLPSLDLKRKQLLAENAKEREALEHLNAELVLLVEKSQDMLPMLSSYRFSTLGLVELKDYETAQDNLMGISLPRLTSVNIAVKEYGFLTKPLWLDYLCVQLRLACELSLKVRIQHERVILLDKAVRKATQRVNLVSKILIPDARRNMRKIKIFLDDNERASVVRSKIAKKKKARQSVSGISNSVEFL